VLSPLGVDRAGPLWGKPEEGQTSSQRVMADVGERDRLRAEKSWQRDSDTPVPPLAGSSGGMTSGRDSVMSLGMVLWGLTKFSGKRLLQKLLETQKTGCGM
jgi:hypothetical protein